MTAATVAPSTPLEHCRPSARRQRTTHPVVRRTTAPGVVLGVAALGVFMVFVDATIVNIAFPSIQASFRHSSISTLSWVLNAYNIVFAAFLVSCGQMADLLGRRRLFGVGLGVFTGASVLCAVAPSAGMLIAARAVQALGGAALVPCSLALVMEAFPPARRLHAVALWTAVAALAAGVGPSLGGLCVSLASWRVAFVVNLPFGVVALLLARRTLVESRAPGRRRIPDLVGALMLATSVGSLTLGIVQGHEWGWTSRRVLLAFAVPLILAVPLMRRCARHRAPVLDPTLLRIRAFALANGITAVGAIGFYAYTLCNVLFLTSVWRYSTLQAGLALTPGPIVAVLVARLASHVVERLGHRAVLVWGALVWSWGLLFFITALGPRPAFLREWLPGMVVLGLGAGSAFPTVSSAAVGSAPGEGFAVASALNSVARQIGAALGVALLVAIIGSPSPATAMSAFHHGWMFAAVCFLTVSAAGLLLPRVRPATVAGSAIVAPVAEGAADTVDLPGRPAEWTEAAALDHHVPREVVRAATESTAEFLCSVPMFAALPAELRAEVAQRATTVTLSPGEWLFHQDDLGDALYVVRCGRVEVLKRSDELPGRMRVAALRRGAVLGELALLADAPRAASVRALRHSELLMIGRDHFEDVLHRAPQLSLALARALSTQLRTSDPRPVRRRPVPVTVAVTTADRGTPAMPIARQLAGALSVNGSVALVESPCCDGDGSTAVGSPSGFAATIDACERSHDRVVLVAGPASDHDPWTEFCLAHADRVVLVTGGGAVPAAVAARGELHGADLVACDGFHRGGHLTPWMEALRPGATHVIRDGSHSAADIERIARRLSGRAIGVVLSGGGARAFAHLGVLEELLAAGVVIDRVGGVSMGAFIGALLALDHDPGEIDAHCWNEWVRRNPINDYRLSPRGLIRGHRVRTMLERLFSGTHIEELPRDFYCASGDLRRGELVVERSGSLVQAVGASMSLPVIAPPVARDSRLLIDGSLLDNLPVAEMADAGEGPVIAVDVRSVLGHRATPRAERSVRIPTITQTLGRLVTITAASTAEAARRRADFIITPRVDGVGLLEFHQLDRARAAGRRAATAALERSPAWMRPAPPRRPTVSLVTVER